MKRVIATLDVAAAKLSASGNIVLASKIDEITANLTNFPKASLPEGIPEEVRKQYDKLHSEHNLDELKKYYDLLEKYKLVSPREKKELGTAIPKNPQEFKQQALELVKRLDADKKRTLGRAASVGLLKIALIAYGEGNQKVANSLLSLSKKTASAGSKGDTKEVFQVMSLEELYEQIKGSEDPKEVLDAINKAANVYEAVSNIVSSFRSKFDKMLLEYYKDKDINEDKMKQYARDIVDLVRRTDRLIASKFSELRTHFNYNPSARK